MAAVLIGLTAARGFLCSLEQPAEHAQCYGCSIMKSPAPVIRTAVANCKERLAQVHQVQAHVKRRRRIRSTRRADVGLVFAYFNGRTATNTPPILRSIASTLRIRAKRPEVTHAR